MADPSLADPLSAAPPHVKAALDKLTHDLTQAAGASFAGLILYGGLARGRFRPGKSDVNVVVLLNDISPQSLDAVAAPLQAAWRQAAVEPMILTPAEVARAAIAFPTKFLDIKEHHVVLAGADPFAALDIAWEDRRLDVEQELRNQAMRLRRRYLAAANDKIVLTRLLARAARSFALNLAALLRLANKPAPPDDRSLAIFEAAATAFDLDRQTLDRLAALRQDARLADDVATLFHGVLRTIARAADIAAGLVPV